MSKTRMSAEDRKLAIVKAALPLFARNGFAETTTKEIAKAAGVSEPLLYKHFPSKEALYLEIQNFGCCGSDPTMQKLNDLEPSASTLAHLVYFLTRMLVLGQPEGPIDLNIRHRLMLNSLLEDGAFARLMYENRFQCFCAKIEACLEVATRAGDVVKSPVSTGNRARFGYHVGAWLAIMHLPKRGALDYKVSREELLDHAVWYILRGMGVTDAAINTHYNPKALALFFKSK
jgi:AcrR family transcriptional regulator